MDVFPLYHLNCVSCRVRLPAQSCALRERSSHHWGDPSVSSTSAGQKPPAVSLQGTITSQNNHLCVSVFNQFHTLTQSKSLHMQYLTLWAIKPGSLVMTPLVLMLTFGLNIKWLVRHRWDTAQPITAQLLMTDSWRLYFLCLYSVFNSVNCLIKKQKLCKSD